MSLSQECVWNPLNWIRIESAFKQNAKHASCLQANGSWSGALGFVYNNTVDLVAITYQRTDIREKYFHFTYPLTFVS